jgi:hypothetical protein
MALKGWVCLLTLCAVCIIVAVNTIYAVNLLFSATPTTPQREDDEIEIMSMTALQYADDVAVINLKFEYFDIFMFENIIFICTILMLFNKFVLLLSFLKKTYDIRPIPNPYLNDSI